MHDGVPRAYRIHLPPKLVVGAPLVIQLHGGGGNGRGIDRLTRFHSLADRGHFAVVSPSGLGHRWNVGRAAAGRGEDAHDGEVADAASSPTSGADDVGFLTTLIDCVAAWLPIDRQRVSVVGISNGAMMSARLAAERPDSVAAIGQVAGTAPIEARQWWHPTRPVPVIQIHGTADPILPYAGGDVQLRRSLRRGAGQVLGVDEWANLLVATNRTAAGAGGPSPAPGAGGPSPAPGADGTSPQPEVTTPAPGVTVRAWRGPTPEADVQFWRVDGGGHTWPGGIQYLPERLVGPTSDAFDATAVMWRFLAAHIRE
ncbi:MAG: alpha/beta hydrolase family esterase [Acidimicrobiales bacterium]